MTEVAGRWGGFLEMALTLRHGCQREGKRWASRWAAAAAGCAAPKRSGANRRKAITALRGSGQRNAMEPCSRFAPRIGAGQCELLRMAVGAAPFHRPIRQKIIGRSWRRPIARNTRFRRLSRHRGLAFALLHQPARQHRRTVLLYSLIYQGHDLLAEIGNMAEARQLVALQTVARSRQQKLPRRCGAGTMHGYLVTGKLYTPYRNATVMIVKRQVRVW